MTSPWSRMDQLLKCGVCSERFRNPKLLPCNHTFCCDPCLDRLVERSRQQLKCPECSAEHRIPLQGGVQGFPNNVTLVRFLELRQQVSGREPDLPPSMQRCNTCKEKGQLEICAHCSRKVCKDCKVAHVNILRKEIELINEQVRHGLKQLSGVLTQTEENAEKIQKNYALVKDQIEEVVRRYTKDLLDTESKLKHELDLYLKTELRNMRRLETDLQVELNNVNSNCDLVDKYVNNGVDWTDAELTDYKEIFQRTMDFLRNFDYDPTDSIRKIKFHAHADPDVVHKTLIDFAEVKFQDDQHNSGGVNYSNVNGVCSNIPGGSGNISGPTVTLTPPQSSALARSQSDNRLAGQRRSKLEGRNQPHNDDSDRDSYRRYRDRFARDRDSCERELPHREDGTHLTSPWKRELEETRSGIQRGRFSSREILDDADGDSGSPSRDRRGIRFEEPPAVTQQLGKEHVTETEDATKGPLSGVIKILDSPHVMERLHHSEVKQKKLKEEEERKARQPPPAPPPVSRPMTRQMSEDEIEKQKKENKAAAAAASATPTVNTTSTTTTTTNTKSSIGSDYRTTSRSTLSKDDDSIGRFSSRYSSSLRSSDVTTPTRTRGQQDDSLSKRPQRDETSSPTSRFRSWRTTTSAATDNDNSSSPPSSPTRTRDYQKPPVSPRQRELPPPSRPPTRPYLGAKSSSLDHDSKTSDVSSSTTQRRTTFGTGRSTSLDSKDEEDRPRLHLGIQRRTPTIEESSSSSSSDSDSDSDSDAAARRGDISPSVNTLLARSAQARRQSASTQARLLGRQDDGKKSPRSWRDTTKKDDDYTSSTRDGLSSRRRTSTSAETTQNDGRGSPYNRLLAERRRSSLASTPQLRDNSPEETTHVSDRLRNGGDSPYSSSAARRNRIARSKSSHDLLPGDDSPEDESLGSLRERLRNRRSTKEKSPEDTSNSWTQYLRNKYSSTRAPGGGSSGGTPYGLSRSRTSAGLAVPRSGSENSSDDDVTSRRRDLARRGDSSSPRGFNLPRRTYMQKSKPSLKIGSRGTEPGFFTWPRGVCVGPDNTIVVADSSNHRIQVFHSTGKFLQEFGSYGSNEGEFDCLAAVTVNRIGQFIVSDRYNHRIQVFDPSGRFIRAFGSEGRSDGRFSYPWGVATDNLGFIYVCDKENHRIQVFQGDGTYVTKFGGIGQRPGELEHPHYVAVSTTNRVIVSDSNNHRIQIFDVNGRLLTTFGSEGSDEAQFKYPRGVAVDDQGYLIVGDSGNNRIQVFHPDGTFLKAFGTWGSGDGEFKGLEGVAVTPSGQILVCDRENHRIQVF